jgi:Ca2+-binding RTX toxin-like protein
LYFNDGAILNNSGNYELQQGEILNDDGVGTFNNSGTFKKTTTGTGNIRIAFNNTGTVNVESGTLNLTGGGVSNGGNFNLTSGKTLRFGGGIYTLNNGAKINGSGNLSVSGGTLDVKLAGGTAIANTVQFTLSGGTLQVDGNWNLPTINNWNGGTLKSSGIITNSGTLTLGGSGISSYKYLSTQLNNTGTIVENDSRLYFYDGAILNNSGNYELQQGEILNYDGIGTLNNSGTFKKTTTGIGSIGVAFNNTGTVEAQSGNLNFANTYTHNNANLILKSGTVTFSNSLNINGGSIEGNGSINVGLTNSGLLNPRHASNTEFGRLTINSNYTETNSARINIQLGGSTAGTNFDQVDINGNAAFDGTLNVSLLNNFTPTLGSTFDVLTYDSLNSSSNLDFTGLSINSTLQFLPQWFSNKLTLKVVEKSSTNLAIAATNANQTEGNTGTKVFTFTVTRSGSTTEINNVNWAVTGTGTNLANAADFGGTLPSGIVTFAANETSKVITVNVSGDTTVEPDESFTVTLSNPTNGSTLGTATAIGTIVNDDFPSITLAVSPTNVTEDGTANLVYTFTRTGLITNPLNVNYTIGGTATNGTDYATITNSVIFAANSATATVTVNPTADTIIENNETVALTLATGTGYTIGTTTAVTGTITNDDGPIISLGLNYSAISEDSPSNFIYTFTRTGATTNALIVNYSIAGTALSTDYTGATPGTNQTISFAAGSATATLTLDPTADTTLEPNETVTLQLVSGIGYTIVTTAAQTATIINDDNTRNQKGTNGNSILLGKNYSDYLTGGTGNDILNGAGNGDYLTGAAGNDTLTGGSGSDTFFFANANLGIDTITDFTPNEDTIFVSAQGFASGLVAGNPLTQTQFILGSSATSASQRFIYNSTNGALLFDADGNGLGTAKPIATLSIGLALTAEDIFVG